MTCQCVQAHQCEDNPVSEYRRTGLHMSHEDVVRSFETLARLLGSPEPLSSKEAEVALDLLTRVPDGGLDGSGADASEFQDAWNRQRAMFKGLPKELPLEESYYKEWTSDESHPLAGRKGLACGDPAAHMAAVLEGFGMALSPEDPKSPDNLAVLLEFVALLIENRPGEEVVAFCTDHLDWLPDLRREAASRGIGGVFNQLIVTVESLVRHITSIEEIGACHG